MGEMTVSTLRQCERCGLFVLSEEKQQEYAHPDIGRLFNKAVIVYNDICDNCATELSKEVYITLDILRLEITRMKFEKEGGHFDA